MSKFGIALLIAAAAKSRSAIATPIQALYEPGNLDRVELDMHLSRGLSAKVIARGGEKVPYADGGKSEEPFHILPDGAAIFEDTTGTNPGGWVYVSNSEADGSDGGVGVLKFDKDGKVIDYKMVLSGTKRNCNGGKTAWNTWVTCEGTSITTVLRAFPGVKSKLKLFCQYSWQSPSS